MTFIFFFNFYLENNVEYSSFLVSDEMFYLFRRYDNQKELHRSHLVSTKTGGTQCGVGIHILAYSYVLVHFREKKKTILNCSKIILGGLKTIFLKKRYLYGIVSSNMKEKKK